MYREEISSRRSSVSETTQDSLPQARDLHLCTVSENGIDRYLSGEILPEMRLTGKSLATEIEETLRAIFKQQRIDVSQLGRMPLHLIGDHRGNAESWRLEYKDGWGAAGKRLIEKTRAEQQGAWVDL